MDWPAALIAAVALPAAAAAIGLAWRSRAGRVRTVHDGGRAGDDAATSTTATASRDLGVATEAFGDSATLVQFSTAYCSRCPATARELASIADDYPGVRHVEVDLTHRPEVADRFRVLQTPTTLILDARGATTARIAGVPRSHEVRDRLDELTGRSRVPS
ncbi:TlpA family protein disulfide reductase [Agromyces mariniharenae]|uniref:Thioredoxin family protein n=1 Tax=Agromyces mariniharenae TaxID=2604423 RepID=A0A5S4V029_9MICO|nr:thioredoxin family protein [Agromyces mariniharenae]TYL52262.1 thioredoxin family protein [Agromyces mariniharenae]